LKDLAQQTKQNTDNAIQELKDELKRMSGKIIDKDHREGLTNSIVAAASEYTLDPTELMKQKFALDDEESSSSDTVSSEDEEQIPHIILNDKQSSAENIKIENTAGWQFEEGGEGGAVVTPQTEAPVPATEDNKLWEEYAGKDARQMEVERQMREHEAQMMREREEREEELRRQEREKRLKQEEEEKKRKEEQEKEEQEVQRKREEERQQRKLQREAEEQQVVLDDQQNLMQGFEHNFH